jgi:hypothetical protein
VRVPDAENQTYLWGRQTNHEINNANLPMVHLGQGTAVSQWLWCWQLYLFFPFQTSYRLQSLHRAIQWIGQNQLSSMIIEWRISTQLTLFINNG